MPAVSKAQQRLMAICTHDPQHAVGDCPAEKIAHELSQNPKPPAAALPEHVVTPKAKETR